MSFGIGRSRRDDTDREALNVVTHPDTDARRKVSRLRADRRRYITRNLTLGKALGELSKISHIPLLDIVGYGSVDQKAVTGVVVERRNGSGTGILSNCSACRAKRRAHDREERDWAPSTSDRPDQVLRFHSLLLRPPLGPSAVSLRRRHLGLCLCDALPVGTSPTDMR